MVLDGNNILYLYAYVPYKQVSMKWDLIGKCQAHFQSITSYSFGSSPAGQNRCFSMCTQGDVVEYNVSESNYKKGLQILNAKQVFSEYVPISFIFAPPLAYYEACADKTFLLVNCEDKKLRLYCPDDSTCYQIFQQPYYCVKLQSL